MAKIVDPDNLTITMKGDISLVGNSREEYIINGKVTKMPCGVTANVLYTFLRDKWENDGISPRR